MSVSNNDWSEAECGRKSCMSTYFHFTILTWTRFGIEPKLFPIQIFVMPLVYRVPPTETARCSFVGPLWVLSLGLPCHLLLGSLFSLGCFPKDTDKTGTGNNYHTGVGWYIDTT